MDYKEFKSNHGEMLGKRVWICDYRHDDAGQKPIRNIKPTEVEVRDNSELSKFKRVYIANTHFRAIGKNGSLLKQVIAPYDNTRTPTSVNIFLTRKECVDHYYKQCGIVKRQVEEERMLANARFDKITSEIEKSMALIESDNY